jgi:uncharacterized protein YacL
MLVLAALGTSIGVALSGEHMNADERLATQLLTLAGAGLGLLTTHYLTINPLMRLQQRIATTPPLELAAVVAGLVLGLVAGRLLSFPLSLLPGVLGVYLPIIVVLLGGYLGASVMRRLRQPAAEALGELLRPRALADSKPEAEALPAPRRYLLDTSVVIDGRIMGVVQTGFLDGSLVVPTFVLNELQTLADSGDELRRTKGRRGLDILNQMQKQAQVPVEVVDMVSDGAQPVDDKLVLLARRYGCPIITNDFNLNKVAELQGVRVLSLNALADAVRAPVVPGQPLHITIRSEGREREQGVSFLDDGTMVVVEEARHLVGHDVAAVVTRVYQTSSGRIIFAQLANGRRE